MHALIYGEYRIAKKDELITKVILSLIRQRKAHYDLGLDILLVVQRLEYIT